jgi:hippurate hydrolase
MRCSIEWGIRKSYPATINNPENVEFLRNAAVRAVGVDLVQPSIPCTASEDFSYYLQQKPGCFWFISYGPDKGPNHSANYDFDDDLLETAVKVYAALIEDRLGFRFK